MKKSLWIFLLFCGFLFSYNEFDSVIQNHLDTVVFTPIDKDSPIIVGLDKEDKTASIGLRLKNNDTFLYSKKQGLFGTIGSSQLDFGHLETNYLSFVRDRENYTIEATLAYSPASTIYSYDTIFGKTSDIYGAALRTTYNFYNTPNFKWDISYSLPIMIFSGMSEFYNQNCIVDEFNRSICETEKVNMKTELPQKSIESQFNYRVNDTVSFEGYFEKVDNVAYTEDSRFLGKVSMNYKFDLTNPSIKKDFNFLKLSRLDLKELGFDKPRKKENNLITKTEIDFTKGNKVYDLSDFN